MTMENVTFKSKQVGGVHLHVDPHTARKWGGQDPGTPTGSPPLLNKIINIVMVQFHAMDLLHNAGYDVTKGLGCLAPRTGPVLCRDQMEEWSSGEANLFEEALDKYGKDFIDIRQDFVSSVNCGVHSALY
jgi:hypothetical protein